MRKSFLFLFLILATVLNAQVVPHDLLPAKPANARPVVDNADILSNKEEFDLVAKLKAYNDSTSNQIVIVTVKSLHGYGSDQYATEIGHFWGVGGQGKYDNGIVILVSTGTEEEGGKKKVFIATGYGLEGVLSAITCKQITDNEMVPSLKQGKYYQAFDNAINAIIKAAAGEYKAPSGYKKSTKDKGFSNLPIFILLLVFVAIIFIIGNRRGGGGSGMMSRRGVGNIAEGLFWASILSGGGGGGGRSSGSDDSGSGGFGDFGGGDFGGGGAGSDW